MYCCTRKHIKKNNKKFTFEEENPHFLSKPSFVGQFLCIMCQIRSFWGQLIFDRKKVQTHRSKTLQVNILYIDSLYKDFLIGQIPMAKQKFIHKTARERER